MLHIAFLSIKDDALACVLGNKGQVILHSIVADERSHCGQDIILNSNGHRTLLYSILIVCTCASVPNLYPCIYRIEVAMLKVTIVVEGTLYAIILNALYIHFGHQVAIVTHTIQDKDTTRNSIGELYRLFVVQSIKRVGNHLCRGWHGVEHRDLVLNRVKTEDRSSEEGGVMLLPYFAAKLSWLNRRVIYIAVVIDMVNEEGLISKHIRHVKLAAHHLVDIQNVE